MKGASYLIAGVLIFLVAIFAARYTLPWLIDALEPWPLPLVAALSWLPLGFIMVTAGGLGLRKPWQPPKTGLLTAWAAAALVLTAQLPTLALKRNPSHRYSPAAAEATAAGEALLSGMLWGFGAVVLWIVGFMIVRRLADGEGFKDTGRQRDPRVMRILAIGAGAASLAGLAGSLLTL